MNLPNVVWCAAISILLLGASYVVLRYRPRHATVLLIHNAVWLGALGLIGTDLIAYFESSATAWLVLALGLLAFNAGGLLALAPSDRLPLAKVNRTIASRRTLMILTVAYFACVFAYLIATVDRFGLETLLTEPGRIRGASGESYLESIPTLARLGLNIGPILFALLALPSSVDGHFSTPVRVVLLSAAGGSMVLLLQRTNLFMAVLWLVALVLTDFQRGEQRTHTQQRRRKAGPIGVLMLAGVLLLVVFIAIGGSLGKTGSQALSTGAVSEPLARSGLTDPYVYYTAGVVAFLQLVDSRNFEEPKERVQGEMRLGDNNPQTWGAYTFALPLKAVPGAKSVDTIQPFIDTAVLTNVFTWLEPFYRDFRAVGVAIGMALMGFVFTRLHTKRSSSPLWYWLQASALSTVFLATFVTKVNNTLWAAGLLLTIAIWVVDRPRVTQYQSTQTRILR